LSKEYKVTKKLQKMPIRNLVKNAVVFSLLVCSPSLFAQDQMQKRTPEQKATANTQWMQQNLQINADQAQKAHDIILKYVTQEDNAMATGQRGQIKEMETNKDADLKGVLTADQFQKYQAHHQQMREQMQQRRANMQQNGN